MLTATKREHIYRNHSIKNACNRCFESFDDPKGLKDHQRAQTPCRLTDNARADVITDEQEELLRVRARANTPEEERWEDMYRIVFPDEKTIPSPCTSPTPSPLPHPNTNPQKVYTTSLPPPTTTTKPTAPATPAPSDGDTPTATTSSFTPRQLEAVIRREIRRVVEPMLVAEVERIFASAEVKVVAKTDEIARGIECRLARTFQWQAQAEPTPEPEPHDVPDFLNGILGGAVGGEGDELLGGLEGAYSRFWMLNTGEFNWDQIIAVGEGVEGCGGVDEGDCLASTGDSAYFTHTGGLDGVGSERWGTNGESV